MRFVPETVKLCCADGPLPKTYVKPLKVLGLKLIVGSLVIAAVETPIVSPFEPEESELKPHPPVDV